VVLDDAFLKSNPAIGPNRCALFLRAVADLARNLEKRGATLIVRHGKPAEELPRLLKESQSDGVFVNRDYEPYAVERDARVEKAVRASGGTFTAFKDLVVFESGEILTQAGNPHVIFSRFRDCWLRQELVPGVVPLPKEISFPKKVKVASVAIDLESVKPESDVPIVTESSGHARLNEFLKDAIFDYATQRDIPAVDGTSRLSPHLKFGTLSPRTVLAPASEMLRASKGEQRKSIETFISEIVWRDFFFNIMSAFPHVARGAYRPEYDAITWAKSPAHFRAWQDGRTGFPIVDAGMRQLKALGWMHNRVRMITASFLCKDLLIDWREGERHFSWLLIDGEFAVNNGNWQWVAGTGTDAQPYFRIFNPQTQGERFDLAGKYIRQWIPELAGVPDEHIHTPHVMPLLCPDYPAPVVNHAEQRVKALEMYNAARGGK